MYDVGPIKFIQSLLRGIFSYTLAGTLPIFLFDCFVSCKVSQLITFFWMAFLITVR